MTSFGLTDADAKSVTKGAVHEAPGARALAPSDASAILEELASLCLRDTATNSSAFSYSFEKLGSKPTQGGSGPNLEARYRALVEQIPAVVFMAYLDRGIGEAYVSPQIEALLGFSQEEWLEDPVRWYERIHPDDKDRWSLEAADMFLSGKPLRSAYRVIARDGRTVWFHSEAKMIHREDGEPWFIHGVAFDITDLKRIEEELQKERNVLSAILDTVGALVVVLDPEGRIIRFNRACELATGYLFQEISGEYIWDLFMIPQEVDRFKATFEGLRKGNPLCDYENFWIARNGTRRLISWSSTVLPADDGTISYVIATGIDITERKRLQKSIVEISEREQRRIGQDLHDGLGQHLTGIAFMSKVQEEKLAEKNLPEAADAAKIVRLVNEAITKTRELARGLLPVVSDAQGLMSALEQYAGEVEDVFKVSCHFQCDPPVLVRDDALATHLFHIAQEAVANSIKHGNSKNIRIQLKASDSRGILSVKDDGRGIPEPMGTTSGMGLHIMHYRAGVVGGALEVKPEHPKGTRVTCTFPLRS